ncbi:MAG: SpaH/EbpB family LPXTG-anchored major pilin [Ancrocorticia sp.]|jgi:fimbrial isopeptide formation D2 family protein/LPXTG-motif cell wall-anchored protein|nr:SpaH/EbpB family LPXTG-anchored major pilin [Ancrocorticia sp.]MCI2193123.1 SpaH/EbpB family LPXTG-anchored major pilin [Ancrocorticia sp.]
MKTHGLRRGVAAVGALFTALALSLGATTAAQADTTTVTPVITEQTGNLHITKYDTTNAGPSAESTGIKAGETGGPAVPSGAELISGVTFSVQKLTDIDLTTNAGWTAAAAISLDANGDVSTNTNLGTASYGTTDSTGVPKVSTVAGVVETGATNAFQNLEVGVYYVKETITPAGVTPSAPFLVTIPITDPTNQNNWLYDVYVYPKNSDIRDVVKTVDDAAPYDATSQTQAITYTITTDVPRNPGTTSGTFVDPTGFKVTDTLPTGVTPDEVTAAVTSQTFTECTGSGTPENCDYTVAINSQLVTVTVTDAGLETLGDAAATADAKVTVTITATVAGTIASTLGTEIAGLSNTATVYPDADSITNSSGKTSEAVLTKWGSFSFTKQNSDGTGLAGAEFKIALSKADAQAGTFIRSAAVTSTDNGTVTITGLRASDFANGASQSLGAKTSDQETTYTQLNDNYIVYWLTETKAPTGYELLAEPIPVALLSDGTVKQIAQDANGALQYDASTGVATYVGTDNFTSITNVEKNAGFTLPLTGGSGTAALTIGGIAILAAVLVVARRRRAYEATV